MRGRGDDAAVAIGGEFFQDEADGFDADGGGDARAFVEEQDCAGLEASCDQGSYGGGIAMVALEAAGAPADAGETVGGEGGFEPDIFDAGGGAETGGADVGDGEGGEAGGEFAAKAGGGRTPKRAERMGVRVVADLVAGGGDGSEKAGMLGGVFADQEKGGSGVMGGEKGEDSRSVRGIGAVIDGEPDLAGVGLETPVHAKEALGVGKKEMVGEECVGGEPEGESGAGRGAADEDGGEFAGEVEGDDEHGAKHETLTRFATDSGAARLGGWLRFRR